MSNYFIKIISAPLIVSFFFFGQAASAEGIPIDTGCVAEAIFSSIAANSLAEAAAALPAGAGQGLVAGTSVAAGGTAAVMSPPRGDSKSESRTSP